MRIISICCTEQKDDRLLVLGCATEGVTLYVNGEAVEGNPYSYIATRADVYTAGTVEVTAVAKKGELESEVASDSKAWVVQQKPEAPVPTFNWDPDTYTMEAVCQGHTVVLMANGAQVSNPYTVDQTTEDQTIEFSAYTVANADESGNSETIKQTVTVPAKPAEPVEDKIYVKFNGTELPVGKKIIFVYENGENSLAMGTVGTKGAPVAVVVANGEVNIANTEVVEFTVGGGEVAFGTDIKQYTLEYSAGFLAYNSDTNFKTLTSIGTYDNDAYWRLQTGDNGYVLNNAASAGRYIRKHATTNKFGPYAKNNDSKEVVIYVEKTDEPVLEDLTGEITISDPDANGHVAVAYNWQRECYPDRDG